MKTRVTSARRFEFCQPHLDSLVQVEVTADSVVIRATRNVFTEEQKLAFVHWLASEGFISDRHRWVSALGGSSDSPVRWLVDYSWLELGPEVLAISRRFATRLFVSAGALWILLISALMLSADQ